MRRHETLAGRQVGELFALADGLEAKYRDAAARVERITPAVLAKAFRGELVEQDPGDEPAEKLLERIRAERESSGTSAPRARANEANCSQGACDAQRKGMRADGRRCRRRPRAVTGTALRRGLA